MDALDFNNCSNTQVQIFGYSFTDFFNIDFSLYCEISVQARIIGYNFSPLSNEPQLLKNHTVSSTIIGFCTKI